MQFPEYRARRLRAQAPLRRLLREARLLPDHLVQAILIGPGKGGREEVPRASVERAVEIAREAREAGIPAVLLSGCAERKDAVGSAAWDEQSPLLRAVAEIGAKVRGLAVFAEVGFARYTDHGRPGVLVDGELDNDATIDNLCRAGLLLAQAGAAALVPSGMIDGAVGNLREALDEEDAESTAIFGLVTHASAFDGERGEEDGAVDPGNAVEAVREASLDVGEGADAVLVRPALCFLDTVARLRDELELPLGAWMGSAETTLVGAEPRPLLESLLAARRAGADFVISREALRAARALDSRRDASKLGSSLESKGR